MAICLSWSFFCEFSLVLLQVQSIESIENHNRLSYAWSWVKLYHGIPINYWIQLVLIKKIFSWRNPEVNDLIRRWSLQRKWFFPFAHLASWLTCSDKLLLFFLWVCLHWKSPECMWNNDHPSNRKRQECAIQEFRIWLHLLRWKENHSQK